MAITFVQGAVNVANPNPITSVSVSWPAPTTANNYLTAAVVFSGGNPGTITPPTNWVQRGTTQNSGSNVSIAVFEVVNAASQSGSQSWSWTNASNVAKVTIAEYSGCATSSPNDGTDSINTGSSSTLASSAFTTTNANDLIVFYAAQGITTTAAGITLSSPLPSGTVIRESNGAADVTDGVSLNNNLDDNIVTTTQSGITQQLTSNRNQPWIVWVYAIKAAGSASTSLFRAANLTTGAGGPFFSNPVT